MSFSWTLKLFSLRNILNIVPKWSYYKICVVLMYTNDRYFSNYESIKLKYIKHNKFHKIDFEILLLPV